MRGAGRRPDRARDCRHRRQFLSVAHSHYPSVLYSAACRRRFATKRADATNLPSSGPRVPAPLCPAVAAMHALTSLLAVAAGLSAAVGQPLSEVRRSGSRRAEDARLVRLNVRDVPLEARSGDALIDFLAAEASHVTARYDLARVDALERRSAEASWDVLSGRRAYGGDFEERSFEFEAPFDIHAARLARRQTAPVTTALVDLYASSGGVSTDAASVYPARLARLNRAVTWPRRPSARPLSRSSCPLTRVRRRHIAVLTAQARLTSGSPRRQRRRRSDPVSIRRHRRPLPALAGQSSSSTAAAMRPALSGARRSLSPARRSRTRASSS